MKAFLAVCFMLLVLQARCDDGKETAAADDTIKVYKRLIPADVLRGKFFFFIFVHLEIPITRFIYFLTSYRTVYLLYRW